MGRDKGSVCPARPVSRGCRSGRAVSLFQGCARGAGSAVGWVGTAPLGMVVPVTLRRFGNAKCRVLHRGQSDPKTGWVGMDRELTLKLLCHPWSCCSQ